MDTSRRAVESYWRYRMVDGVTSDEDKVAPVYKLEEFCELLRTSEASIVKEVSDFVLKRLDHKSPVVKQKALRLIKYAVGKSGTEFRREMQRNSAVVRQLVHYKGLPDPLKGDALNKAVRETANEAISAIFASDETKAAPTTDGLGKRIQGFGNTNFEVAKDEKKSFLSEVVDLGSASIKQGLSTFAAAHSIMKNDTGTYKSPTLQRSLTRESEKQDKYEGSENHSVSWSASGTLKSSDSGTWGPDSRMNIAGSAANDDAASSHSGVKSREERLLETIVTSRGVRLQPTRDALQLFLVEAAKLDALSMSRALELKLQSPLWQVRMKAICVLESILRKKDDGPYSIIASYFSENCDSVVKCCELPQVSLRERVAKVLNMLDGEQTAGMRTTTDSVEKTALPPVVQMPDLIDTGDVEDNGSENSTQKQHDQSIGKETSSVSLVDDLFGSDPIADVNAAKVSDASDPFADVSFHVAEEKEANDLFSGMTLDNKSSSANKTELPDIFGGNSEDLFRESSTTGQSNLYNFMNDLNLSGASPTQPRFPGELRSVLPATPLFNMNSQMAQINQEPANGASNGILGLNSHYPQAAMQYNMPPHIMFNQAFAAQQMNYGAMGAFIAQQQLLQNLGNFNPGFGNVSSSSPVEGVYSSPLPNIFQSNNPIQSHVAMTSSSKKEETKAFDFVSDHLAAVRGSKKLI